MQELIKILVNLRSLRSISREMTLKQLNESLEKLTQIVNERTVEEEKRESENKERNNKLEAYCEMLLADGLDPEELLQVMNAASKKSNRTPRQAKYEYIDNNGQKKTWTGQGRTPNFFKDKDLADYLI